MKINKLFLLLLALPLAFASCEPTETPQADPVLTLTSENSFQFTPEGGQGTITYTLENKSKGTELTATTTAEWITNITVGENITFTVDVNEETAERTDRILVSYGNASFNVFVKQEGVEPVENFTVKVLDGVYYGTRYSDNYNVAIYLSDIGFTEDGYVLPDATYYVLDLYMDNEPTIDAEGWLTVPAGKYTYDGTDSQADMSIGLSYSMYSKVNSTASAYDVQLPYDAAELVVSESGLELIAYIEGVKHIVTYVGEPKIFAGVPEPITGGEITAPTLYGEYYGDMGGIHNYNLYLSDQPLDPDGYVVPNAYYFSLDLYGAEPVIDAEGYLHVPAGTYTYDVNDDYSMNEVGREYSGAYKVNDNGTEYQWIEAFEDATVIVKENGIEVNCIVAGAEFNVTYTGEPKIYVGGAESYAAAKRAAFVPAKSTLKL
ncbi:MAG: BACON domain-containing protein [Alistipes sp.]|nr:BACON domain-containing protein [Alistipes sp.]